MLASEPNAAQRLFLPWLKAKTEATVKAGALKPVRVNRAMRRHMATLAVDRRKLKAANRAYALEHHRIIEAEGIPARFLSSHQRAMRALKTAIAA